MGFAAVWARHLAQPCTQPILRSERGRASYPQVMRNATNTAAIVTEMAVPMQAVRSNCQYEILLMSTMPMTPNSRNGVISLECSTIESSRQANLGTTGYCSERAA